MSERLATFVDEILQRYFDMTLDECPSMARGELERLLTDDGQRRVHHARVAASDWAESETHGRADITSERLVITPRGLLYAAALSAARPTRTLYYLSTPQVFFDPMADIIGSTHRPPGAPAAVDSRIRSDLVFARPLDRQLRRTFDTNEVLRFAPSA